MMAQRCFKKLLMNGIRFTKARTSLPAEQACRLSLGLGARPAVAGTVVNRRLFAQARTHPSSGACGWETVRRERALTLEPARQEEAHQSQLTGA